MIYSDDGYDLPPLIVHYHEVASDHSLAGEEKDGQGLLFKSAAIGLSHAAAEKRDSLPARIDAMMRIINADPDSHYLLWHDMETERHAIAAALPEARCIHGSMDLDEREQTVMDFSDGKFKYFATKPILSGSGCNFQRYCHKASFLALATSSTTSFSRFTAFGASCSRTSAKSTSSTAKPSARFCVPCRRSGSNTRK